METDQHDVVLAARGLGEVLEEVVDLVADRPLLRLRLT